MFSWNPDWLIQFLLNSKKFDVFVQLLHEIIFLHLFLSTFHSLVNGLLIHDLLVLPLSTFSTLRDKPFYVLTIEAFKLQTILLVI